MGVRPMTLDLSHLASTPEVDMAVPNRSDASQGVDGIPRRRALRCVDGFPAFEDTVQRSAKVRQREVIAQVTTPPLSPL
jgi:hypothetical protein